MHKKMNLLAIARNGLEHLCFGLDHCNLRYPRRSSRTHVNSGQSCSFELFLKRLSGFASAIYSVEFHLNVCFDADVEWLQGTSELALDCMLCPVPYADLVATVFTAYFMSAALLGISDSSKVHEEAIAGFPGKEK